MTGDDNFSHSSLGGREGASTRHRMGKAKKKKPREISLSSTCRLLVLFVAGTWDVATRRPSQVSGDQPSCLTCNVSNPHRPSEVSRDTCCLSPNIPTLPQRHYTRHDCNWQTDFVSSPLFAPLNTVKTASGYYQIIPRL